MQWEMPQAMADQGDFLVEAAPGILASVRSVLLLMHRMPFFRFDIELARSFCTGANAIHM